MAGDGWGSDEHPGTGDLGPPAEVEVLAEEGDRRVVAAEGGEEVGADERGRPGDAEDVADGVVLLLVELAPLDGRHLVARLVDHRADLQQAGGVVPGDQLRADDAGVGPVRLLDEGPHGVGLEGDVVVAEQVEGGALDDREDLVGGGAEPGVVRRGGARRRRAGRRRPAASGRRPNRRRRRAPTVTGSPGQRSPGGPPRTSRRGRGRRRRRPPAGHRSWDRRRRSGRTRHHPLPPDAGRVGRGGVGVHGGSTLLGGPGGSGVTACKS